MSTHGTGGEGSISLIAASLVPSVEGGPSWIEEPMTSTVGVEVQTSRIPPLTSLEVQTSTTENPAALSPPSRTTSESSASQDRAFPWVAASCHSCLPYASH